MCSVATECQVSSPEVGALTFSSTIFENSYLIVLYANCQCITKYGIPMKFNFHFSYYAKCYKIIYLGPSYIFCEGIVTIAHFATLLMFLRDLFKEKFKDERKTNMLLSKCPGHLVSVNI